MNDSRSVEMIASISELIHALTKSTLISLPKFAFVNMKDVCVSFVYLCGIFCVFFCKFCFSYFSIFIMLKLSSLSYI